MGNKQPEQANNSQNNYLYSPEYQAMYNQIYSNNANPLMGERFYSGSQPYSSNNNPIAPSIEVKKTVAINLEMCVDKKTLALV